MSILFSTSSEELPLHAYVREKTSYMFIVSQVPLGIDFSTRFASLLFLKQRHTDV